MSDKFVFLSQFYADFRKNDFEYWSIIPLNLFEGTTYQFISMAEVVDDFIVHCAAADLLL